ncbi:LytR/AlgR family response regulator transcription factor [Bizionia myxarmorum]|uniref:Response regulator transcription factor n=1 Tax=Bizionia myxarmorum TaxID=291186 RepID=A0A5D0RE71_9FLAO|nr:LytTR family transcriptional regulator DNA-binding domain-containing protein [Bizionia myxarmorum]TYB79623.1 response regulator transcription factor [Bizionia myxarmorum]
MINHLKTKILIVEDDVIIADYIAEILQEEQFSNLKVVHDKASALQEMANFLPDIILMDINLEGINDGIELSKSKNNNAAVIFLTGQYDFALMNEALTTNPDAYLTKPIKHVDLLASINLAMHKKELQIFQFKDGYDTVNLEYDDIKYLMADGNYVNIYTTSKKYTIRQSLNTLVHQLPKDIFKQTHRSYLVNKNKVQRVTASSVFVSDLEIPLSRPNIKHFK